MTSSKRVVWSVDADADDDDDEMAQIQKNKCQICDYAE